MGRGHDIGRGHEWLALIQPTLQRGHEWAALMGDIHARVGVMLTPNNPDGRPPNGALGCGFAPQCGPFMAALQMDGRTVGGGQRPYPNAFIGIPICSATITRLFS